MMASAASKLTFQLRLRRQASTAVTGSLAI